MKEYIERDAACEKMPDDIYGFRDKKILRSIPAADVVEVRYGRWVEDACGAIWCSNCSHAEESCEQKMYRYRYCPNCGAKMDGGGTSK